MRPGSGAGLTNRILEPNTAVSSSKSIAPGQTVPAPPAGVTNAAPKEQFDFLDFGDPTFAPSGFIPPRPGPQHNAGVARQPVRSPSPSPDWQTHQTSVSVHTAGYLNDRSRTDGRIGSPASSAEPVQLSQLKSAVNKSDSISDSSGLLSSFDLSSLHRIPSSFSQYQNRNGRGIEDSAPALNTDLVLNDFTARHGDTRPYVPLEDFTNRRLGAFNKTSLHDSDRKAKSVIGTGSSIPVMATGGRELSNIVSATGKPSFMSDASGIRGAEEMVATAPVPNYASNTLGDADWDAAAPLTVTPQACARGEPMTRPDLLAGGQATQTVGGATALTGGQQQQVRTHEGGWGTDVYNNSSPACLPSPSHAYSPLSPDARGNLSEVSFALPGSPPHRVQQTRTSPGRSQYSSTPVEDYPASPYIPQALSERDWPEK
ncbi:hypothetical protein EGW08_021978, partial [Elysia chlorotica]